MKKLILGLILLTSVFSSFASHIAGGELFYEYIGPGSAPNTSRYRLTMRLFRDCNSAGQTLPNETVILGIYNSNDLSQHGTLSLPIKNPIGQIQLNTGAIPCLVNAPNVCFQVGIFTNTVDLPNKPAGYTISWIRCCRSDNLANLNVSTGAGATFTTIIPGTSVLPVGNNSSPQFLVKDTALVCANKNFVLDFGATDADGDSLTYTFCSAYSGGTSSAPNPPPPGTLSLSPLPYRTPNFSGSTPLGTAVSIDRNTGKITGVAPAAGRYVINVCVTERRNGILLNTHRKDFILEIGNCDYAAADPVAVGTSVPAISGLPYKYVACDGFNVKFTNKNPSSTIKSYHWDFGVPGSTTDTSSLPSPTYVFPDSGVYLITLTVTGSAGCIDTDSSFVGVYPGFTANFQANGGCFQSPFSFTDQTFVQYGVASTWQWDFGDASSGTDISSLKNPNYQYPSGGVRDVQLIVSSNFGCVDTLIKQVNVLSAPQISLPFRDTLICSIDTLPLIALGTGMFSWSPNYNIINSNSANPLVYPKDTAWYIVTLNDAGCVNKDSIKVNVLDFITVDAGMDTTICLGDEILLSPNSQALGYRWTPTDQIVAGANTKTPAIRPDRDVTYHVTANLGKCQDRDSIRVKVVPYPKANAGNDVTLCYGDSTRLNGQMTGSSFTWYPSLFLSNPSLLNPVASPPSTVSYVLTVTDTLGCPKPVSDTVLVEIVPQVVAYAGNDTVIVANQPLQLNATGGSIYQWSPSIGMDSPTTSHPIVILGPQYDSIKYRVRVSVPFGCFQEDEVKVVVFKTAPDLFVPTAFTPNGDGRNDVLKPIAVGIKSLQHFRVFNRWGQLVFSTTRLGDGWNGRINSKEQAPGTYVYMAEGTDYLDRKIVKKGTVVLIK